MKVIICGSRGWHDPLPMELLIAGADVMAEGADERLTIVHGNAPKGGDRMADRLGRRWRALVVPVNADWKRWRGGAGHERNERMLIEHPDTKAVFAFRASGKSTGTDDMVEIAVDAGVPTYIITRANPEPEDSDTRPNEAEKAQEELT